MDNAERWMLTFSPQGRYGKSALGMAYIVQRVLTTGQAAGVAFPGGDVVKLLPANTRQDVGEEKPWLKK